MFLSDSSCILESIKSGERMVLLLVSRARSIPSHSGVSTKNLRVPKAFLSKGTKNNRNVNSSSMNRSNLEDNSLDSK